MFRFMLKFLLRENNIDMIANEARILLIGKINDKPTYKKHNHLIVAMVAYYVRHHKFTYVQLQSIRRVLNG